MEICKVVDIATDNNPTKGKKRKAKTPARGKKQLVDSDSEEENYDHLDRERETELSDAVDLYQLVKRRRLTKPEDMDDAQQE